VRIDGYHCHQDHLEFRHLVDTLHQRGLPFTVGVIPAYWNPETKKLEDLDSQPEFVAALRYAQSRGGRLLLQGYVNTRKASTGQEPTPFFPASGPATRSFNGLHPKSKFLALNRGLIGLAA
jgi:uncharacterized protein YdaL